MQNARIYGISFMCCLQNCNIKIILIFYIVSYVLNFKLGTSKYGALRRFRNFETKLKMNLFICYIMNYLRYWRPTGTRARFNRGGSSSDMVCQELWRTVRLRPPLQVAHGTHMPEETSFLKMRKIQHNHLQDYWIIYN